MQNLHQQMMNVRRDLRPCCCSPLSTWPPRFSRSRRTTARWTGGVWDRCSTRCSTDLYVKSVTLQLFMQTPRLVFVLNKTNVLSPILLYSPRFTVATQPRCTTTSCTRLPCSSPTCPTQAGSCWRGSCRRTAPRGWGSRMTL